MIKIVHDRKSLLNQHYECICYGNFPVIFQGFPSCFFLSCLLHFFIFFPQWRTNLRCKEKIITAIFQLYSAQYHLKCVIYHLVIHFNKKSHSMQRQKNNPKWGSAAIAKKHSYAVRGEKNKLKFFNLNFKGFHNEIILKKLKWGKKFLRKAALNDRRAVLEYTNQNQKNKTADNTIAQQP